MIEATYIGYGHHSSYDKTDAFEKMKRREKKLAKERADATITTRWLILLGPVHAFLILVPMIGNSWINTKFTGFGVSMVTLRTSLFVIDVNVDCDKNYLEDKICQQAKKFEGVHALYRARDTFCSMPGSGQHACTLVRQTFMTSYIVFFFYTLSAGFHMAASSFLYYYWEHKALPEARRYAMVFFFLAPFSAAIGLVTWTGLTPNLNELARSWSGTANAFTAGIKIFSHQNVHDVPYGWCWFYSLIVIFLSLLSMLVWPFFFVEHVDEEKTVEAEERMKDFVLSASFFGEGYNAEEYPRAEHYGFAFPPGGQHYGAMQAYNSSPGGYGHGGIY